MLVKLKWERTLTDKIVQLRSNLKCAFLRRQANTEACHAGLALEQSGAASDFGNILDS